MDKVYDAVEIYERVKKNKYKILIEDSKAFSLKLAPKYFHHLAGFHYLSDMANFSNPIYGTERFYSDIRRKRLDVEEAKKSVFFSHIQERLEGFAAIEDILSPGEAKVIVDFDPNISASKINAKYYLFKREGTVSEGKADYYNLFIGYDTDKDFYYPSTFIVEHSNKYISGQTILNCKIEIE